MKTIILNLIGVCVLCGCSQQQVKEQDALYKVDSELSIQILFGTWGPDGEPPGNQSTDVVFDADDSFGITINLFCGRDYEGSFKYRENLILPAEPETWGDSSAYNDWGGKMSGKASADNTVFTHEETVTIEKGDVVPLTNTMANQVVFIQGQKIPAISWGFAEGDPMGTWTFEVFINDKKAKTISFNVKKQ